jgi:hypothetical protein
MFPHCRWLQYLHSFGPLRGSFLLPQQTAHGQSITVTLLDQPTWYIPMNQHSQVSETRFESMDPFEVLTTCN